MTNAANNRLYADLAWLWPLWGDPATAYAAYCEFLVPRLKSHARRDLNTLLNAGCGGGKNLFTLRRHFQATGLDLSEKMLALAAELNPGCELIRGDLRDYGLDREFDAIFLDDAISYLLIEGDLERAFREAFNHLAPGGVLAFSIDATSENFQNKRTQVFQSIPSAQHPDTEVTYITNDYLQADGTVSNIFIYLIRERGELTVETDHHVCGLFPLATWQHLLERTGFQPAQEYYVENGDQYPTFFCLKP
ncbi:MAG: class I SAM-dependent methyltransferase [Candidatus Cloacimonetes bacterium]|nr:class I SAM-dependent methyltransferase [Candidatus Cloacimonadota bacterium]